MAARRPRPAHAARARRLAGRLQSPRPRALAHEGPAPFSARGASAPRRCPFSDVAPGRPNALDQNAPANLARTIRDMALRYVVITSVDRDDLKDGGAAHFAACIREARALSPLLTIEVLVPDFRGRMDPALTIFKDTPPDVFNHNL